MKELEDKIREALPHLKEIGVGCLINDYHSIKKVIYKSREINNIILLDVFCDSIGFDSWQIINGELSQKIGDKDIEFEHTIIGKDIMLNDVLNWFTTFEGSTVKYVDEILCEWDLTSPYLKDQSEALIKYLNEL